MSGFLRPSDDDFAPSWTEDKVDIEPSKETTFVYNPHGHWNISAQRQKLPIYKSRDYLVHLLNKHRVVIVVGETGCGKSTQIPQYLLDADWCKEPGTMVCIQSNIAHIEYIYK